MHRLLDRQLRRLGLSPAEPPSPEAWAALLERVERAYGDADQERYLLERSVAIASQEMRDLYDNVARTREARFQQIVESASDVIYTVDLAGRFTSLNTAAERVSGYNRDELLGRHFVEVVAPEYLQVAADATQRQMLGDEPIARFEIEVVRKDGTRIPLELSTQVIFREGRPAEIHGIGRDMSDRKERERMTYLAHHDPLTGLPNRYMLEQVIAGAASETADGNRSFLAFLDLDNFKLINDTAGHAAGDRALQDIAAALAASLRAGDTLVRVGGDEFAVLMRNTTEATAAQIADRLRGTVEQTNIVVEGRRMYVGASVGLTEVLPSEPPGKALARADGAMYRSKDSGRNRVSWGEDTDSSAELMEANQWVPRLRAAMAEQRLLVYYQPIVDLREHRVLHYEALVRLRGEDGTIINPGVFVSAAERFGFMPTIDRFVIDEVVQRLEREPSFSAFVNISGVSLADTDLLEYVAGLVATSPGIATRLGFEITETALVADLRQARAWMARLRGRGVRFALDDYGSGFSAISYIRNLPLDQIKIDGSFVRGLAADPKLQAMVRAIVALAEVLGLEIVAESIENQRVLDAVRELGIDVGQGFFLGAPGPIAAQVARAA